MDLGSIYMSRLSSTPGIYRFGIRVVLLLDLLPSKAAEPSLPKHEMCEGCVVV